MYLLLSAIISLLATQITSHEMNQYESYLPSSPFMSLSEEKINNIIEEVNNNKESTWKAGHNFDDYSSLSHLLGSINHNEKEELKLVGPTHMHVCPHHKHLLNPQSEELIGHGDDDGHNHTKAFDGRVAWARCKSVHKVYNQGRCASDWVIAPISAINDRLCISNKTSNQLSPHEPLSCCKKCGWGCKKGYPLTVYQRFVKKGLVTGGDYKSNEGCQPYEIAPCGKFKACSKKRITTPKCKPYCYNGSYKKNSYTKDLVKGYEAYSMGCPFCAGDNLKNYGPLTASMEVYEDFLTYKSGIYKHKTGLRLGKLTVRLIGYNDKPAYWIAVNSWGKKWGEKGLFKIARGEMECGIDTTQGTYVKNPKGGDDDDDDDDDSSSSSEE